MRKLILLPIIAILIISIAANSVLLIQQTSKLGEINSGIAALGGEVSTLTRDVSTLHGNVSGLQGSVASLQGSISTVQGSVSGLQSTVSGLQGTVSGLQNTVTGFQGTISGLQGTVSGLQGTVSGLQGNISSLQAKLNDSDAKLAALQAALTQTNANIAKVQSDINAQQMLSLAQVIALVEPTVVEIKTAGGSGSGIIITQTGYVLTAEHVVTGFSSATISLTNGERFGSSVIARDTQRDIAILKINSSRTNFPAAVLGSSANTSVGEEVLAAGFALKFAGQPTITKGIVSAFPRVDQGLNYIQTDAPINPGNSGGPLFNLKGQIIGINVAKYVDVDIEGIGLAIPIDETKTFIQNNVR